MKTKTRKPAKELTTSEARQELVDLRKQVAKARRDLEDAETKLRIAFRMRECLARELSEAAKLVKADPDCLGQLVKAAQEMLRKHYPKAAHASVQFHTKGDGAPLTHPWASIPILTPEM